MKDVHGRQTVENEDFDSDFKSFNVGDENFDSDLKSFNVQA